MEDDDAVLVDNLEFADSDPRLRASQVGALEDDDEESGEGAGGDEEEEKEDKEGKGEEDKEKEEPIYFQGEDNNSKGFEVDTPQIKPAQGSDKVPVKEGIPPSLPLFLPSAF